MFTSGRFVYREQLDVSQKYYVERLKANYCKYVFHSVNIFNDTKLSVL